MQYASNAVLVKARAMHAGRITDAQFAELASCRTLEELLSKLRQNKRYARLLEKVPANLTVEQAEELLRLSVFDQLYTLSRYERSGGKEFFQYYVIKNDIAQILRVLRMLINGSRENAIAAPPPFFGRMSDLNLFKLASVNSFPSLLEALSNTPYRGILEPFAPLWGDKQLYLHVEAACNRYICQCLTGILHHDKSDKKQVDKVFRLYFDSEWIIALYRMKKLKMQDTEVISGFFSEAYTEFTKAQMESLSKAEDIPGFMRILSQTPYAEAFQNMHTGDTEVVVVDYVLKKYLKELRFFTDPAAMVFCYMVLAENEISNIIRVVEGIRYGIGAEQIMLALTGVSHNQKNSP